MHASISTLKHSCVPLCPPPSCTCPICCPCHVLSLSHSKVYADRVCVCDSDGICCACVCVMTEWYMLTSAPVNSLSKSATHLNHASQRLFQVTDAKVLFWEFVEK